MSKKFEEFWVFKTKEKTAKKKSDTIKLTWLEKKEKTHVIDYKAVEALNKRILCLQRQIKKLKNRSKNG